MKHIKEFNHLAVFFCIILMFLMSPFKSCKETDKPLDTDKEYLEVYTNKDIYYVDVSKLQVTQESTSKVKSFNTFGELSTYVGDITSSEANETFVELPEEYELITKDTPIYGSYDAKRKELNIYLKHNYNEN